MPDFIFSIYSTKVVFTSKAVSRERQAALETTGKTDFSLVKFFLIKTKQLSYRKQTLLGALSLGAGEAYIQEQAV